MTRSRPVRRRPALSRPWTRGVSYRLDGREFTLLSIDYRAAVLRIAWRDTGQNADVPEAEMLAAARA